MLDFDKKSSLFRNAEVGEFYHHAVCNLLQSINLPESMPSFFDCLQKYMPLTYLVYMSSYGKDKASMIRISQQKSQEFDQQDPLSLDQIKSMYHFRTLLGTMQKGIWITEPNSPCAQYLSSLNLNIELKPPYFYFFMVEDEHILGNVFFGCDDQNSFSEEQRNMLDTLWEPLFFLTRSYCLYHEMKMILEMTQQNNIELRRQISGTSTSIIGANSGLAALMREVRLMAPSDIPVLITGETGTGKELVAQELHKQSPRRDKNFVAVNCGGIAPSLIDSELFGHVKGAFTGAMRDYKGRFERSAGGTLFLDEIGELPMEAQTRLLRVLQDRTIERLGGNTAIPVDFRLITATNRDLWSMMREGTFREDLFFRLSGVTLNVPPLRERPQDIPLLVPHYLTREAVRMGVLPRPLASGEMERLLAYSWPGNVRELINVVTEGFVRSQSGLVRFNLAHMGKNIQIEGQHPRIVSLDDTLSVYFQQVLTASKGRISGPQGAAMLTGLKPNTLRAKLDKLGINYGRTKG